MSCGVILDAQVTSFFIGIGWSTWFVHMMYMIWSGKEEKERQAAARRREGNESEVDSKEGSVSGEEIDSEDERGLRMKGVCQWSLGPSWNKYSRIYSSPEVCPIGFYSGKVFNAQIKCLHAPLTSGRSHCGPTQCKFIIIILTTITEPILTKDTQYCWCNLTNQAHAKREVGKCASPPAPRFIQGSSIRMA
jgi:hypothetical protein